MTDCPDRSVLQAFLQEELGAEERSPLEEHIEACRACQSVLDEITAPNTNNALLPHDTVQTRERPDDLTVSARRAGRADGR